MKSKLFLKENPTLKDFQKYVADMEEERGFTETTVLQNSLQLGEEIGELFKAIRKTEKMKIDSNSKFTVVDEELADIIMFLCSIANRYNIDLETAFRNKEERNMIREWK